MKTLSFYLYLALLTIVMYLIVAFDLMMFSNEPRKYYNYSWFAIQDVQDSKPYVLDSLELDCEGMISNPKLEKTLAKTMKKTKFSENLEAEILNATDKCAKLDELFNFVKEPRSEEEAEFPLAYGVLAYKDIVQVLFMLSSFYHPQNVYCIGVSENAGQPFIDLLRNLTTCWPNVYLMERPLMKWGGYEIINSVYNCMEFLTSLKSDWKYFQYLSGSDVPLKTNLEMVRIFKALNETPNLDIVPFEKYRLKGMKMSNSPLPLYKSSLSALIPRKTADALVRTSMPGDLLYYLRNTVIPDESFWGPLLANTEKYNIPGSISGSEWLAFQKTLNKKNINILRYGHLQDYYISRYQVYSRAKQLKCHGNFVSESCVFAIADLTALLNSKKLVGHKIYMNKYPAAFFCALKEIQHRAENPQESSINTTFYENLPQVQMARGVPLKNVSTETLIF